MSKWFWPCVISISLFKAHLRSKTNQLFLIIAAWIYFGDGKHSKEILTGLIKRRRKKKNQSRGESDISCVWHFCKKKNLSFFLWLHQTRVQVSAPNLARWTFTVFTIAAQRGNKEFRKEFFHMNHWALKETKKHTRTYVKVSNAQLSHGMHAAVINPRSTGNLPLPLKHSSSKRVRTYCKACEYINHRGDGQGPRKISRGNKQYVAPMLMGFSPLTCAAILIIN